MRSCSLCSSVTISLASQKTVDGLNRLLGRLKNVNTGSQWETLLHTIGGGVPVRRRGRAAIRVQPTAVSRRVPGVSRGSKRRAADRQAQTHTGAPKDADSCGSTCHTMPSHMETVTKLLTNIIHSFIHCDLRQGGYLFSVVCLSANLFSCLFAILHKQVTKGFALNFRGRWVVDQ